MENVIAAQFAQEKTVILLLFFITAKLLVLKLFVEFIY